MLPRKDFPDGLRLIVLDADTAGMASIVDRVKTFVLYLDHKGTASGIDWNDIVANPVSSLAKVISPSKGRTNQRNNEAVDGEGPEDEEDFSTEDSDFHDSDYDLEDDGGLFVDNVDGATDEGVAKGKKIATGTKRAAASSSSGK